MQDNPKHSKAQNQYPLKMDEKKHVITTPINAIIPPMRKITENIFFYLFNIVTEKFNIPIVQNTPTTIV